MKYDSLIRLDIFQEDFRFVVFFGGYLILYGLKRQEPIQPLWNTLQRDPRWSNSLFLDDLL